MLDGTRNCWNMRFSLRHRVFCLLYEQTGNFPQKFRLSIFLNPCLESKGMMLWQYEDIEDLCLKLHVHRRDFHTSFRIRLYLIVLLVFVSRPPIPCTCLEH